MPEDGALDVQEEDAALDVSERVASEALLVDVEGFEGPLDLLLVLARTQKVVMARDQKGREFFARGQSTDVGEKRVVEWGASLSDLLKAYARIKTKEDFKPLHLGKRDKVLTLEEALEGMRALIGETIEWASISSFLPEGWQVDPKRRRSAMASSFAASLELAKRGEIELKQERVFAPVLVRKKASAHV